MLDRVTICTCDAAKSKRDPTGTADIRRRFRVLLNAKWRRARVMVRAALVEQNILGLGRGTTASVSVGAMLGGATATQVFQRWIDSVLQQVILSDEGIARPFIRAGYDAGVVHAENELGEARRPEDSIDRADRVGTLSALSYVELQGIIEAVSQQSVRAVAGGLLVNTRASKLASQIQDIIDKVGVSRSDAMIELLVVRAFSEATLDIYQSSGIVQVGLVPETRAARRTTDSIDIDDASRRTGPGSRSSRKRTPSASTIGRIRRVESAFAGIKRVNVETAEDDKVCPVCERISENGPYKIDRARSLIPAHVRCRCIFIPA